MHLLVLKSVAGCFRHFPVARNSLSVLPKVRALRRRAPRAFAFETAPFVFAFLVIRFAWKGSPSSWPLDMNLDRRTALQFLPSRNASAVLSVHGERSRSQSLFSEKIQIQQLRRYGCTVLVVPVYSVVFYVFFISGLFTQ